jgi:hypothetical protein
MITMENGTLIQIPEAVAGAIVKVMAGVRTLQRGDNNTFGNYSFASTDAFLEAVNPLCADAGLIILQIEEDFSVEAREMADERGQVKKKSFLTMRFGFILGHSSGATWGPIRRSIIVPAAGPQAFGTAQSYALKQFMRSLFQIATGERDDADYQPDDPLPEREQQQSQRSGNGTDDVAGRTHSANIRAGLDLCETSTEVLAVINDNKELLGRLADGDAITRTARAKYKQMKAKEDADKALGETMMPHHEQETAQ